MDIFALDLMRLQMAKIFLNITFSYLDLFYFCCM